MKKSRSILYLALLFLIVTSFLGNAQTAIPHLEIKDTLILNFIKKSIGNYKQEIPDWGKDVFLKLNLSNAIGVKKNDAIRLAEIQYWRCSENLTLEGFKYVAKNLIGFMVIDNTLVLIQYDYLTKSPQLFDFSDQSYQELMDLYQKIHGRYRISKKDDSGVYFNLRSTLWFENNTYKSIFPVFK